MFRDDLRTDGPSRTLPRSAPDGARLRAPTVAPPHHTPCDGASRGAVLQALDLVPEAVFFLNAELRIVDANAAAAEVSGCRREALRGLPLEEVVSDAGDGRLRSALESTLAGELASAPMPARYHAHNGAARPAVVQLHHVDQDSESRLVLVVHSTSDAASDEMPADRDYLTSLPARAALEARLRGAELRARQRKSRFAILFIDVDRFKSVNDTNGHRVGDLVLQTLSRRLLDSVRPGDFVARYGGDEFVAIIEDVRGEAEVEQIAQRIRDALAVPIERAGVRFEMSASVGVAVGHAFSQAAHLLDQADRAMYRVKQTYAQSR